MFHLSFFAVLRADMSGVAVTSCLFFLLSVCSACYISNCPIGGKRSIMDAPLRKVSKDSEAFRLCYYQIGTISSKIHTFFLSACHVAPGRRVVASVPVSAVERAWAA